VNELEPARPRRSLLSAVLAALVTGCGLASPATTLAPKSDFARVSYELFLRILWWDLGIFLVVIALLVAVLVRFRERDPAALPTQVRGNARLELVWTIVAAVILTFIAFPTVGAIFRTQAPPPATALRVRVIAHQWWWQFEYPDLGIQTASDLHLLVGQPVSLELTASDVIHSFWVPRLGGKRDTIPGVVNRIVLTPDMPGEYPGRCAEFCGLSHANMLFSAVVQRPEEFQAWVASQRARPAQPPDASLAAKGLRAFSFGACVGCHRVDGVSAGALGPDLTHVGSRRTIASGMLPNVPENLARWLKNAPAVKPGSRMPDLRLSDEDVQALVAYLSTLK
jgi:cytochrome c oxidase subunit 2